MKTLILSFLLFGIQFILAQTDLEMEPTTTTSTSWAPDVGACALQVVCKFMGNDYYGYQFSIDDMQSLERCNIVMYGQYWMDRNDTGNGTKSAPPMLEADKNAIISLTELGIPVFILAGYLEDTESKWADLLCPIDNTYFVNQKNMLIEFVTQYKITGVIFDFALILYTYKITTTENIVKFLSAFKDELPTLKIGFTINGQDYAYFTDSEAFDYDAANKLVDLYFIDMTASNFCSEGTKNDSVNPIVSLNPYLYTIEQQCTGISQSSMDKLKTVATLQVFTTETLEDALFYGYYDTHGSFSELCQESLDGNDTSRWCFDTTLMLYNQGKFVSNYVCNIMLQSMETDDYLGTCGCEKFIVTNTIINGWQTQNQLSCDAIDLLKPGDLTTDLQGQTV